MATALSVADFLRLLFGSEAAGAAAPAAQGNLVAQGLELLYVRFIAEGPHRALLLFSLLLLVLYGLKNLFGYMAAVQAAAIRVRVVRHLRDSMLSATLRRPMAFFYSHRRGDIVARFGADVAEFDESYLASLQQVAVALTSVLLYTAMLFYINLKLTLAALLLLPVVVFAVGGLGRKLKRKSETVQRATASILAQGGEVMEGARIVKAHTAIQHVNHRFDTLNARLVALRTRMFRRIYMASPVSDFLGNCVVVGVMLFGALLVVHRDAGLTAGLFVSYVMLMVLLLPPGKELSNAWSQLRKGKASADRIEALLGSARCEPVVSGAAEKAVAAGSDSVNFVEFNNVSFSYQSGGVDVEVLRDVSFGLRPGTVTALVGPSGGGKSTVVDLLLRFYEPTAGTVEVCGQRLSQVDGWLRMVAVARQEAQLVSGSVADNIRFGYSCSDADLREAARLAGADLFIEQLPGAYNAEVGEGGGNLSGGQRARLSLARAFLRKPRLLILDEPTASLDAASETLVMQSLETLRRQRPDMAVLLIAHRLSTARNADQILTMQDGSIAERGTHQELMQRNGPYAAMARLQQLI